MLNSYFRIKNPSTAQKHSNMSPVIEGLGLDEDEDDRRHTVKTTLRNQ